MQRIKESQIFQFSKKISILIFDLDLNDNERRNPLRINKFEIMKNFQQKTVEKDSRAKPSIPNVREYMVTDLITFKPDTRIKEVVNSLLDNRITGAPVLNSKGQVVGMIDDKDCLQLLVGHVYYNRPGRDETVSNYMSNIMKSISIHDNIVQVADIFLSTKYKRLLVMDDDGKLAGQISRRDILRAVRDFNSNAW